MGPEPVNNPVNTLVANAGPNTAHSSAIKDVNDGANAIHKTTKAAVDDLGFNKPSLIKWGKWLVGKLGPFGYVVTIVLSPILIPASLTYDAGRGMKLLFRKITRVEEPVQKLLPMVAKQVEDARKLEQHKQDLESRSAEISNQLAALKVHSGELKGSNDQFAQRAQQLDQKLNREQNRNHELNILLEQLVRRADDLELENADSSKRYQALKVALDKQLAEKSLRIQQFSKELEAARQQHDQEDDIWARQAQADEIRSLECKLAADRQQMCDLEARYQAKVRTLEGQHQFEVMELEAQHRLEVEALETHHQDHMQALNVQNEAKVQELLREISDLHELAKTKEHNLEDRLKPVVELLETKIAEVEQQLEARNTRIAQLNQQCSESTEECLHLKLQLDELNEKRLEELNLKKLAQMMYENDVQKLQEKLDEMSSSAEMVSRHVQTAAVTVIEPRERVDTASQADIEPPVLIDTAS
ncbi:hypothetical protein, partial [Endozoicomonas sp. YOMI1]|uniref:hypothetical protein n=1 Tax=Endozoicomonas sp. YOMI1 TaxID=2828739 RepID=UPI002147B437